MPRIAVTGADGPVGQRLIEHLSEDLRGEDIVAIDGFRPGSASGSREMADLKGKFAGCDAVVHIPQTWAVPGDATGGLRRGQLAAAEGVLDACGAAEVGHVVVLSSAVVYGAWPDNAVPLPESAPIKPNPGAAFAEAVADVEEMAMEWADSHPNSTLCLARSALVVGVRPESWLTRDLGGLRAVRVGGASRPLQLVHVDDLVSALALLAIKRVTGPVNIAPEGWVPAETVRALASGPIHLGLPRPAALAVLGLPEAYVPYLSEPWVVASDRLQKEGWSPNYTNEEALVAGRAVSPWQRVSPRRRQEVALAGSAVAIAGVVAGVAALVRRSRRGS